MQMHKYQHWDFSCSAMYSLPRNTISPACAKPVRILSLEVLMNESIYHVTALYCGEPRLQGSGSPPASTNAAQEIP